jgi:predicted MFS family arabinose efflux permease
MSNKQKVPATATTPSPTQLTEQSTEQTTATTQTETSNFGSTSDALKIPTYRKLLTAWTTANIGDSALFLTISIWVKTLTGNDAFAASVFIVLGLPALFAPVFGLMADRYSRRKILIITNVCISFAVLSLLTVQDSSQLWLIYLVTFLYSMATYVNAAAQGGILRDTLPENLLAAANGLFGSIDQGLRIVAPLAAAGAFAIWGIQPIAITTAALFLVSAVILCFIKLNETKNEMASDTHWFKSSLEGFGAMRSQPRLWSFVLALTLAITAGGSVFPILDSGLGLPATALSIFVSVQGVFAVIAGLNAARLLKNWGYSKTMVLGLTLFVLAFLFLMVPNMYVVGIATALVGAALPLMVVATVTMRQIELPLNMQGRSGAAMNVLFSLPQVAASAIVAALISSIAYPWILGAATIVAAFGFIPLAVHRLRAKTA